MKHLTVQNVCAAIGVIVLWFMTQSNWVVLIGMYIACCYAFFPTRRIDKSEVETILQNVSASWYGSGWRVNRVDATVHECKLAWKGILWDVITDGVPPAEVIVDATTGEWTILHTKGPAVLKPIEEKAAA